MKEIRMYGRGPEKSPEAGAHREISRFPGGPVRHWYKYLYVFFARITSVLI